ncbi:tubulin-folding cofactor B-like [Oppia nitens]|uniref:tubulin-folding cofactor B-like n=1 Tax=Oppia nitens TaxID=1686743 RepID=UPI0023DB3537|nr:tubulin-folding cofactor B-like [Oppia nitens]
MSDNILSTGQTLSLTITTNTNSFASERRFAANVTICELKAKLELITGANSDTMTIQLLDNNQEVVAQLDDNSRQLQSYLIDNQNKVNIHVIDSQKSIGEFEDVSNVEKFELPQEDYEKRTDSVLAFKMNNKLGRFAQIDGAGDNTDDQMTECDINVGQRCEVCVKGAAKRRATVQYVGTTRFKPGLWIGVEYDEPLGKNDGSVDGHRYFQCKPKYGGFIRPNDVIIGDFPEMGDTDEDI